MSIRVQSRAHSFRDYEFKLQLMTTNSQVPYLVDIADTDLRMGVWETWEIDAVDEDEARSIAEGRLDVVLDEGIVIGSFRATNIRRKV